MADDEPFSFDDHIQKQLDPYLWAKRKASDLFDEIREVLGDERARRVFALWGDPPSPSLLNEIENKSIIDRLDLMTGGNVKELARQIAGEKYTNPTPQQIDVEERQLRRLNAIRKKNPFWPQQRG
jgi:hypothetical protein